MKKNNNNKMKIKHAIKWCYEQLKFTSLNPMVETKIILCQILKVNNIYLYTHENRNIDSKIQILKNIIKQRKKNTPLSYLIKCQYFWNIKLFINKYVFIPRSDTECLIYKVLQYKNKKLPSNEKINMLELGTGSGAISISIAKEKKYWNINATDISHNAIKIAKYNATQNNINNINFFTSNWFSKINTNNKFHIICSNPPYIDINDKNIELSVLKHEPKISLFAPNKGLLYIQHIIKESIKYLNNNGMLILEHGYQQGIYVKHLFIKYNFTNIKKIYDLNKIWRGTLGYYYK